MGKLAGLINARPLCRGTMSHTATRPHYFPENKTDRQSRWIQVNEPRPKDLIDSNSGTRKNGLIFVKCFQENGAPFEMGTKEDTMLSRKRRQEEIGQ